MASYATLADFDIWGLPPTNTAGLDPTMIEGHLSSASRLADSYIGARGYALPLTQWGEDLRSAVCRIAAFTVLVSRGINPDEPMIQATSKSRDDAIAWLRDVAKGIANLDQVQTTPARSGAGLIAFYTSSTEDRGW